MSFRPRALLVTGGAGFIGQNLVHVLAERWPDTRIVVLDALTYAANPSGLASLVNAGRIQFVQADITDLTALESVFREHGFDAVAHLAAESHVDRSIAGPDAFINTNIIGSYNLLKCALASWQNSDSLKESRYLHVSTDEVFGDLEPYEAPFSEASAYAPSSPYSASKAASDHLTRAYGRTFGLPVIVTNCSNNYGPYQHPEKLIPLMIIHALQGKPLPIYGDGANVRDWLHVRDHCDALALVLEQGQVGETYNIGGNAERTNLAVVTTLCDQIDAAFAADLTLSSLYPGSPAASARSCRDLITYVKDRPGHDRRYAVNAGHIQASLGHQPTRSFEQGIAETVLWYLANGDWWRRAISGDFSDWMSANYGGRASIA